jgi:hypothetical protein
MKNRYIAIVLMIVLQGSAHEVFLDHAWQIIPDGVTISLRNKLMDDPYVMTIKITNTKTNLSISKSIDSGPNDWNQITFPDDFHKIEGIYHMYKDGPNDFFWEATVDGRLIMSGKFTYPHSEYIWTTHE